MLLDYTSFLGEVTRRRLDPYGVVFHSGRWFVTGHDHTREALRTFRVDRVAAVRGEDAQFTVPEGFDPAGQVLAGIAAVGWAHEVRVVAHADPAEVRRRLPATVGTIEETEDGAAHRPRGAAGRHGAPARRCRPAVHRRGARRSCAKRCARSRTSSVRRRTDCGHRRPASLRTISLQVRDGLRGRADPARPDAVHRDPVPGRLRLHRGHAGGRRPLHALVLVGSPTFPGCQIRVRAIGMFCMSDEKGPRAVCWCAAPLASGMLKRL